MARDAGNLQCIKLTDRDFLRTLENAIRVRAIDWLADWLAGRLAGRLVGRLAGCGCV
jgi:hypothetical protein